MMDWYPALRHAHIGLAGLSVLLFVARGLGVLAQAAWPMRGPARALSVLIDSLLLAAGLALTLLLQVTQPWLVVKLLLLVAYIGLGTLALKRAPTRAAKALAFVAALLCVGFLYSVARAHHPFGVFAP